jgi:hypothetical protein
MRLQLAHETPEIGDLGVFKFLSQLGRVLDLR